ncbi:hypothetical protein [Ruegeria sp. THAF57]|uniref:hypothetical protein n=1 Tax=Ruegeria sp. THAF57 TaxID=2744555 RepID=UPI0015E0303C|nr:hypothetical protein [Ruegeria sp. THAF57]
MVAIRHVSDINERWNLTARGGLIRFDVNGDDQRYLVLAGFDWEGWEDTQLRFGYQFHVVDFSADRSDGEFDYDVGQNGLYAAITFRFQDARTLGELVFLGIVFGLRVDQAQG